MEIREILILLNCLIIGATIIFVFYKTNELDMVDEGYDKNKRNLKGSILWFFVAAVVGVFALLLMVLREIYQWKRYKLPSIEWEDICRYGFTIVIGSMIHVLFLVISAGTSASSACI